MKSSPGTLVFLAVLAGGPLVGGFREPAAWSLAAAALWVASPQANGRPAGLRLWLAWAAWCVVCAIASPEPLRSLGAAAEPATMALAFAWASGLASAERRRVLLGLLAWSVPLAAAAFLTRTHSQPHSMTGLLPSYYNYTASVSAAALAAAAAALARPGAADPRLAGAALASAAAVLAASGSRGAAAAAAVGVALALWRAGRRGLVGLAAAAALAAPALAPDPWLRERLKLDKPGANQRPAIWAAALGVANENPVFGTGPGRFEAGFRLRPVPAPEALSLVRYGLSSGHAHSEPLQAAAETGWVGLLLLLAALAACLRASLSARGEPERESALAAVVALTAQAAVDNILALPWLRLVYATLLGIAAGSRSAAPAGASGWRALLAVLGVAAGGWGRWPDRLAERELESARLGGAAGLRVSSWVTPADPAPEVARAVAAMMRDPPDPKAARAALERARVLSPYRALLPLMIAELDAGSGDWEGALKRSLEASGLEPNFLGALLLEADALLRLGRNRDAAAALARLRSAQARVAAGPPALSGYERVLLSIDPARVAELQKRIPSPVSKPGSP